LLPATNNVPLNITGTPQPLLPALTSSKLKHSIPELSMGTAARAHRESERVGKKGLHRKKSIDHPRSAGEQAVEKFTTRKRSASPFTGVPKSASLSSAGWAPSSPGAQELNGRPWTSGSEAGGMGINSGISDRKLPRAVRRDNESGRGESGLPKNRSRKAQSKKAVNEDATAFNFQNPWPSPQQTF